MDRNRLLSTLFAIGTLLFGLQGCMASAPQDLGETMPTETVIEEIKNTTAATYPLNADPPPSINEDDHDPAKPTGPICTEPSTEETEKNEMTGIPDATDNQDIPQMAETPETTEVPDITEPSTTDPTEGSTEDPTEISKNEPTAAPAEKPTEVATEPETTEPTDPEATYPECTEPTNVADNTEPTDTTTPTEYVNDLYLDDYDYPNFYGRLYIPSVGIDVALYYGNDQSATDRTDSASIFAYGTYDGEIIADHSNQDFSKLFGVSVGDTGYIKVKDGSVINIRCIEVFDGHNTGPELTNNDYTNVMGKYDYLMYTCKNGWRNILICQWDRY